MNRREFMGSMSAAATVGPILHMPLPIGNRTRSQLPRASWLGKGLIDAGGSHEPYIFVIRRGGESLNARKDYEWNQSEELIRQLHEQGIEMFHTHLYKGFGLAAEKPEMEDARRAAAIARSTSIAPPSATRATSSPVDGSTDTKVSPETASAS